MFKKMFIAILLLIGVAALNAAPGKSPPGKDKILKISLNDNRNQETAGITADNPQHQEEIIVSCATTESLNLRNIITGQTRYGPRQGKIYFPLNNIGSSSSTEMSICAISENAGYFTGTLPLPAD